jgi:hypothetical protein
MLSRLDAISSVAGRATADTVTQTNSAWLQIRRTRNRKHFARNWLPVRSPHSIPPRPAHLPRSAVELNVRQRFIG